MSPKTGRDQVGDYLPHSLIGLGLNTAYTKAEDNSDWIEIVDKAALTMTVCF